MEQCCILSPQRRKKRNGRSTSLANLFEKSHEAQTSVKGGHFINGNIAHFDAIFFNITPNEAKTMDPQQRMLLEVTYEAFENAGIRMEDLVGSKTSCFVGDFSSRDFEINLTKDTENSAMHQLSGNTMSIMSNRLSYFFGLNGSSMTIDTACSSGLVALHLACQSIKSGESNMAIVAGVNLMQSPDMTMALDALHLLSPDGKSYAFDSRANGYGRGEGFAVVILKSETAARKDNDVVRATIRGSGCNHDGKTKGLHLPSAEAQEALIRETYMRAGLDMKDTAYCEAHGTGTAAGDPLEAKALAATLGKARKSESPLMIGSVKTNIGHLEGAAGLASVIKTVLALERGVIPPSVNFKTPTPRIPFASNNLEVVTEPQEWPNGVRRASINSFGFGGTNSHVILEAAHPSHNIANGYAEHNLPDWVEVVANGVHGSTEIKQPRLFCWSTDDEKGIARLCESYAQYVSSVESHRISADDDRSLVDDLWYTLAYRRSTLHWKSWCIASTIDELHQKLTNGISRPIRSTKAPRMAFVFTGQGAQWHAMGRELWTYGVYRESIEQANACLASAGCSWSVIEELNRDADSSKLNEAIYSQPLCTVVQVALIQLLRSWGIHPRAVVGHSSGEIAAAYCMGALSSASAWKLAYQRGQLSKLLQAGSGTMMSVGLGETEAHTYLDRIAKGKAVVACINSPSSVTVSGDVCALDQLDKIFKTEGIFARRLKVEVAYHSHHMKTVAHQYLEAIQDITTQTSLADPEVKMFSSVTGNVIDTSALTPEYWVANLVSPVKFSDAVHSLSTYQPGTRRRRGVSEKFTDLWLEVGPHGALATPVKQTLDDNRTEYLSVLQRGRDAISTALAVAGELWSRGYAVDVASTVSRHEAKASQPSLLVDAPKYPWNHGVEYWSEPRLSTAHRFRKHPRQDLLGSPIEGASEPAWRHFLRMSENPWMEDHQVQ